LLSGLPL